MLQNKVSFSLLTVPFPFTSYLLPAKLVGLRAWGGFQQDIAAESQGSHAEILQAAGTEVWVTPDLEQLFQTSPKEDLDVLRQWACKGRCQLCM